MFLYLRRNIIISFKKKYVKILSYCGVTLVKSNQNYIVKNVKIECSYKVTKVPLNTNSWNYFERLQLVWKPVQCLNNFILHVFFKFTFENILWQSLFIFFFSESLSFTEFEMYKKVIMRHVAFIKCWLRMLIPYLLF